MAFNFNWAPLTADAGFYERAQELLNTALNKSPKPPIIVDDILVNELSLGHVPPDLEILEIGDLAEDRFRGIFKMSYNGDAFITLKTRIQANPLNTHLSTRPSFASPQPLAASSGLTIPLQITLSDIKLSGFIILVFSKQKGITLVFRNDPLESLKVSSTFDSIPFVRDHLQKEIEGQVRILLMDELPAIIHRLSLRLFSPEHKAQPRQTEVEQEKEEHPIDPFASPPVDAVDSGGHAISAADISSMSLDSSIETQSLFSRKNLIRLATLTDSHRTLSLFTPNISDVVFRAWAGPIERGEMTSRQSPIITPAISRTHSYSGSMSTTYSFSDSSLPTRPALSHSLSSYTAGGGARHSKAHGAKKRRKRVVNLRKKPDSDEHELISEDGSTVTDSTSVTGSESSISLIMQNTPRARPEDRNRDAMIDPVTPPLSPRATIRASRVQQQGHRANTPPASPLSHRISRRRSSAGAEARPEAILQTSPHSIPEPHHQQRTLRQRRLSRSQDLSDPDATPHASMFLPETRQTQSQPQPQSQQLGSHPKEFDRKDSARPPSTRPPIPNFLQFITDSSNSSSIAEQAWMMKLANEVARRYQEERHKGTFGSSSSQDAPPPAYAQ